jgi:phosphoribosylanthranilate isomerase
MTAADAGAAVAAGADAIGMILHANARRRIDPDVATGIVAAAGPFVTTVGVFVDLEPERILEIAEALSLGAVQLHGRETPADAEALRPFKIIKAIKCDAGTIRASLDDWRSSYAAGELPNLAAILLETPSAEGGGTGEANDFALIASLRDEGAFAGLPPVIVAGGLRPDNAARVARVLSPYAVDVSTGIEESFGRKSPELMRRFIRELNAADA